MWAEFAVEDFEGIDRALKIQGWNSDALHQLTAGRKYLVIGINIGFFSHPIVLISVGEDSRSVYPKWFPLDFFKIDPHEEIPSRWAVGTTDSTEYEGMASPSAFLMGYRELVYDADETLKIVDLDHDALARVAEFVVTEGPRQDLRDAIDRFDSGALGLRDLASWALNKIETMDRVAAGKDEAFVDLLVELVNTDEFSDYENTIRRIRKLL